MLICVYIHTYPRLSTSEICYNVIPIYSGTFMFECNAISFFFIQAAHYFLSYT